MQENQVFSIFNKEEAPLVSDRLAHAVAQCLFDTLSQENLAWREHIDRFSEHPGCTIETTCDACFCCSTIGTIGCVCENCRCGQPGPETGHAFVPLEQAVLSAARKLTASESESPGFPTAE